MKPIFKSVQLQTQFDDKGFVKMKLLTLQQVENLLATYQTVAEEHEKIRIPYITTSHSNNPDLITNVDTVLQKIMAPAINQILENCNLLFGNYLVKMPVTGSETEPHQDITFVDETKYTSVNIWVALQDIDIKNGCMYFLEGSHKLMPTLRPTQHFPWAYENVKEELYNAKLLYE
mgnify:FL=1